ncbi:MAG: hypothetical protein M3Y21_04195 [Candidatus Eremiobacteraeota bacterium]|nr:hypothetical protein [Candidatus Eremiobacteraeota bacterium]
MVTRLRSLNIVQWGLVSALIYAILGLVVGIFWLPFAAIMGGAMGAMSPMSRGGVVPGAGIGVFAVILFPILYFILGFIFGIIFAALYNLVARWTGGVEMTLDSPSSIPTATL